MINQTKVGPLQLTDGTESVLRVGKSGEQVFTEVHGRYYEQTSRGYTFSASTQAAVTFAASLVSTSPVYTIYNPAGSGVNASLISVQLAFSAAPAAATVIAIAGNTNPLQAGPTTTTAITTQCNLLGSAAVSKVKVYSVATLGVAPVVLRTLASIVAASSITPPYVKDEIAGELVLAPGGYAVVAASAAASAFVSVFWEEQVIV
jgi:hypothetical protein